MSEAAVPGVRTRRWPVPTIPFPVPAAYLAAGLGVALGVTAIAIKVRQGFHPPADTALSGTGGFLFLGAGVLAHARRPENPVGLLMVLVGVGFFAEDLQLSGMAWLHSAGLLLTGASSGFLTHLVLAFPDGRLRSRGERVLVGVAYAGVFGLIPLAALFNDTGRRPVPRQNLLLVSDRRQVGIVLGHAVDVVAALVAAGLVAVLVRRWVRAGRPMRRVLAPVILAGLLGGSATVLAGVLGAGDPVRISGRWVYAVAFCLLPLGFLAWVLHVRLGRSAVGTLLASLREPLPAAQLRTVLARALGDPSLQVGYWRPDSETFVDGDGNPLGLPAAGSERASRLVERDGRRVALLVYDPALREDPNVLDAVTAAAELALDNQRLAAQVQAQLAEVLASRSRIVAAADAERRRLERDLHDGPQLRLLVAALSLGLAQQRAAGVPDEAVRALLADAAAKLDEAIGELRELARGIHPAILTDAGLVPALRALAGRTPLDVQLAGDLPRLDQAAEAAGYFVAAEALSNTVKHARATRVRVAARYGGGVLRLELTDDGVGGADIGAGSGLLGLRDRVSALGGTLTVRSERGQGTAVSVAIPCRPAGDEPAVGGDDSRG
ncbi:MAG TPA: sensor histidine kinase [Mycobacteriales bacterium]